MDVCSLVNMYKLLAQLFIVIFIATFFEPKAKYFDKTLKAMKLNLLK